MYVNLPKGETLAANMREQGEHYTSTEGADFPVATEVAYHFPKQLQKYDWDGKKIREQDPYRIVQELNSPFSGGGLNTAEKVALVRHFMNKSRVFEWGLGDSTLLASRAGVKHLTGVDSSSEWVTKVQKLVPHFDVRHVDIGPVAEWGNPCGVNRTNTIGHGILLLYVKTNHTMHIL